MTDNRQNIVVAVLMLCAILLALVFVIRHMVVMPGKPYTGALPLLSPVETEVSKRLVGHVAQIARHEHNVSNFAELEQVARYLEQTLRDLGYRVAQQQFSASVWSVRNIEVEIHGTSASKEIVIVGAHYDSALGAPGANDNGSGTAALLELARLLKTYQPQHSIRLVFFANEEPPYFQTEQMGSLVYARRSLARREQIVAMLSLETIGYYSDLRGSQLYPLPFNLFYPDTGNFIGFVSNLPSRALLHRAVAAFRRHASFPSEGVAAPSFITGVDWSDHWAFWEQGYPALMVTDTALFRYPHYHTAQDTPDKLDYERTARVVVGLAAVIKRLAQTTAD